ncbi:MAG: hypothetical protein NTW96_00835 [Planctomycetia bacterium]|nr:hypothetical protein [Planctomycetia bacterium]
MTAPRRRRPVQFGVRTMLAATAAVAVLLALVKWMGATPKEIAIVSGILVASVLAAVGLVLALAASVDRRDDG